MAYVHTPLGGRNIMSPQEREMINDQRQQRSIAASDRRFQSGQTAADDRQQRALEAALAQAQVQADADRYRVDAGVLTGGTFDQKTEAARMDPRYIQAQMQLQQYEDQRADNAWRRDLQGSIGEHIGSQIQGQLAGPDAGPFLDEGLRRQLALAVVSPELAAVEAQREMAQQSMERRDRDIMDERQWDAARMMLSSPERGAQERGAAIMAQLMSGAGQGGQMAPTYGASDFLPSRQISAELVEGTPKMQLALQKITEAQPSLWSKGDRGELSAAINLFVSAADEAGVPPDDAMTYLELWARENDIALDAPTADIFADGRLGSPRELLTANRWRGSVEPERSVDIDGVRNILGGGVRWEP